MKPLLRVALVFLGLLPTSSARAQLPPTLKEVHDFCLSFPSPTDVADCLRLADENARQRRENEKLETNFRLRNDALKRLNEISALNAQINKLTYEIADRLDLIATGLQNNVATPKNDEELRTLIKKLNELATTLAKLVK